MRLLVFLVWSQSVPHFKLHNIDQQQNILTKWLEKLYNCGVFFFTAYLTCRWVILIHFCLLFSNALQLMSWTWLIKKNVNFTGCTPYFLFILFSRYQEKIIMIIASNSHWLSCKRENIKETDNVHCRGQLRALETEKILVPHGVSEFFSMSRAYEKMKNVFISLLSSKLSSILFYLQMKNMFN